ncbi:unnamed protein product [Didymodactylos carnosus]|nr:unnamed protein product [Didymodactylos carnosus]CAF4058472.1 unnamed protein product [Didymodactylos carnosus]
MLNRILILTIALLSITAGADKTKIDERALSYLKRYGYSTCESSSTSKVRCSESPALMLKTFQRYFGLKITGKLDKSTRAMMNRPRCTVIDKPSRSHGPLGMASGFKWPRLSLKYRIESFATDRQIKQEDQIRIIEEAFNEWSKYTSIKFVMVCPSCPADMFIRFERGDHGDGSAFSESTLAHAFFPTDGRIHFNSDFTWTAS